MNNTKIKSYPTKNFQSELQLKRTKIETTQEIRKIKFHFTDTVLNEGQWHWSKFFFFLIMTQLIL